MRYRLEGVLQRLQQPDRQLAKRIISRLHRNLGHPTNGELKRFASVLIERVQDHECAVKMPGMQRSLPVLMVSDTTTRFLCGRVIWRQSPEEFILALEGSQVDDHCSWASDYVKSWCSEQGIELNISPGQSQERLANRGTNVRGYSPAQWVLGYTPHIPGLLSEEPLPPPSLDPADEFLQKLQQQKSAANAVFSADVDARLRRAMNRKFAGQLTVFHLSDLCYYYRDGPGTTRWWTSLNHLLDCAWRKPCSGLRQSIYDQSLGIRRAKRLMMILSTVRNKHYRTSEAEAQLNTRISPRPTRDSDVKYPVMRKTRSSTKRSNLRVTWTQGPTQDLQITGK